MSLTVQDLINQQEQLIKNSSDPGFALNTQYNVIALKQNAFPERSLYAEIKTLVHFYVEYIKHAEFGYDYVNVEKLNKLIDALAIDEQASLIEYTISNFTRELPDLNHDWLLQKKRAIDIEYLFKQHKFTSSVKAIFLYTGTNTISLFTTLVFLFLLTSIVLLPAISDDHVLFKISYHHYTEGYLLNHFMNIIGLFADLEIGMSVEPLNWVAFLLMVLCKILYITFIANYIYIQIIDRLSTK